MSKRLDDQIPKINDKATKKAVERTLERYRSFLITLPTYLMPKVTPSYSVIPPSQTNEFHSSTEDAAIERLEFTLQRNEYINRIHEAVNTLKEEERFVIIHKYLLHDIGYDPDIWMELGVGKTKYYEIKGRAMLRLAFALKIEVYRKPNEVKSA